ncbi:MULTISPECIES: patatin-like phospholipase family protein [Tenebrionibacter/Tenebrionicola group]|uniref:Patatin family protein n=2 Tax=Tenebrionibacter/Tenebrionicola group TaxID=2969848 RepID=A0A8K0V625_9ENTR|nr:MULTISPECIES: patatin family protein [Tenebrionibacter/Tenebrionicola group]MBK4715664.1 patatin family protein [Tenebrionibacter intestinalis]MBV5096417.1 patatin family protein [Tenebrionicola larvae]
MGQRIPVTLGNIAPLALQPFEPGKMALVCEGGGQRGIFTAGVLDEFMINKFDPFHSYFGTSAGAQNLSAFVCHQPGYARRVITGYTTRREFFNPVRFVRGGNLIDLDWLVSETSKTMPLSMDTALRRFDDGKAFYMCACRSDDYAASYFSPLHDTWLDIIRASSAIPGFYRSGVMLDNISYQDGGISDAVPVREAARRGAKTLVVIRTVPSQMYYTPQWFKHMERWLNESSLMPLVNLVHHHEESYLAIQRFIENPPGDLRIIEIYPPSPLQSSALGSRPAALRADYRTGRLCGRYFLATVGKLLAKKPPLRRFTLPLATPVATKAANPALPVTTSVLRSGKREAALLPACVTPVVTLGGAGAGLNRAQANDSEFSSENSA